MRNVLMKCVASQRRHQFVLDGAFLGLARVQRNVVFFTCGVARLICHRTAGWCLRQKGLPCGFPLADPKFSSSHTCKLTPLWGQFHLLKANVWKSK